MIENCSICKTPVVRRRIAARIDGNPVCLTCLASSMKNVKASAPSVKSWHIKLPEAEDGTLASIKAEKASLARRNCKRANTGRPKPVMVSQDGEPERYFPSLMAAARFYGVTRENISAYLGGRATGKHSGMRVRYCAEIKGETI